MGSLSPQLPQSHISATSALHPFLQSPPNLSYAFPKSSPNFCILFKQKKRERERRERKVGWGGEVGVVCLRRQTPEGGFPASLPDIAARCSRTPREVPEPFGVTATEGLKMLKFNIRCDHPMIDSRFGTKCWKKMHMAARSLLYKRTVPMA